MDHLVGGGRFSGMGLIRFVVWSSLCVALGIFLATFEVNGRTPWKLMQSAWQDNSPRLEKVKDEVKSKLSTGAASPKETHTEEDKQAIDALISKRTRG